MNVTSIISPLPWENGTGHITDAKGDGIAQCFRPLYGDKDDNAAFIVKAVNAHDALIAALNDMLHYAYDYGMDYDHPARDKARAALTLAAAGE